MFSRANCILARPLQFKYLTVVVVLILAFSCVWILDWRWWEADPNHRGWEPSQLESLRIGKPASPEMHSVGATENLLITVGPTAAFRDNLRPDVKYITSWPANGWSNQVIEFMNLIYLAQLTERIPIIPRFRPVHLEPNTTHIDFSDVFDLPRLKNELNTPFLEWREVKEIESNITEDIGCWDVQHKSWDTDRLYLEPPTNLNLGSSCLSHISYTWTPNYIGASLQMDTEEADANLFLWPLASLAFYTPRAVELGRLPPLYMGISLLESTEDVDIAWHAVGRYMHFTPEIQRIVGVYRRRTLGIADGEEIPPVSSHLPFIYICSPVGNSHLRPSQYIAVHVRRGDFTIWCNIAGVPHQNCFAPLSAYDRRVSEVRAQLVNDTGVNATRVIIASDETDPAWWAGALALGWVRSDHNRTVEEYGLVQFCTPYPIIIDAGIRSSGDPIHGAAAGFVGTDTSTVSILARRRVATRGGVAELVK
ncbi:hypothetical protein K438DRAFT_1995281 [Mycena galopus ATCC 62051]|nr:hypothetical protein K438DRAFT_1995281 [Mycena galopus ATCC 62051]